MVLMPAFRRFRASAGPSWIGHTLACSQRQFNPCATLSTVLVYPAGASSGTSLYALLFHDGTYVGTATPNSYVFSNFNAELSTDTVALNYRATQVRSFATSARGCSGSLIGLAVARCRLSPNDI
jgi:LppP/LprE lipoprotein